MLLPLSRVSAICLCFRLATCWQHVPLEPASRAKAAPNAKTLLTPRASVVNQPTTALDRRSAIASTLRVLFTGSLATGASIFPSSPVYASYIDPVTDPPKVTNRVYLDVVIGGKTEDVEGRIVIDLYGELMPRTVDNFVKLCDTNAYAGTTFYRVLSEFSIQGGAIGDPTGKTGQSSLENGQPFEPDNYNLKHTKTGLVSAVRGPTGAIDSRFFINCNDDGGWGDDRYAVFGIVEADSLPIVKQIEIVDVQQPKNNPKREVKIVASGQL